MPNSFLVLPLITFPFAPLFEAADQARRGTQSLAKRFEHGLKVHLDGLLRGPGSQRF